ncbi:MAG: hypothetical protein KDI71_02320 [Xanthomonadales bacterium]|nr:hypothetical protein [Xanthomonadales bacterium]
MSAAASPVCEALAEFVNTATVDQPVQLTVGTDWGRMSKYCTRAADQPKLTQLCDQLLSRIARAFVHPAIEESLACAPNLREYSLGDGNIVSRAEVILRSLEVAGAREGIRVEFHYLIGLHEEMEGQWLTIRAIELED